MKGMLLALFLGLITLGCVSAPEGTKGNFVLLISDAEADIADFESLDVRLSEARVFRSGGFEMLDLNDTVVDLTEVVGDKAIPVLETELDEGNYTKIELYVSGAEGFVNGTSVDVKVPSDKLQITKPFEIKANETTEFVFDINVVKKGQEGGYNLLPVISESGVVGRDLEVEKVGPG